MNKQEFGALFTLALIGTVVWWFQSSTRTMALARSVPNVDTVNAGSVTPTLQSSHNPDSDGNWSVVPDYLKVNYPVWQDVPHVLPSMVVWSLPDVFGPQQIPPNI